MNHRSPAPGPKEAATLILLRQRKGDIEILMVKRHPANLFVPDCYVFPGGGVESDDLAHDMEGLCLGLDRQSAYGILGDMAGPAIALATWIACIRETYEETGILMACNPSGTMISSDSDQIKQKRHHDRLSLLAGEISFSSFIRKEDLRLATDRLFYFSHWITPVGSPIRYDVRFFIAEAPSGQEALHDGRELTEHVWISPRRALALYQQNEFDMVLPTVMTLRDLCRFATIQDALAYAKGRCIPAILTKLKRTNQGYIEVMPDGINPDSLS